MKIGLWIGIGGFQEMEREIRIENIKPSILWGLSDKLESLFLKRTVCYNTKRNTVRH